jgi:hypothetical protein
MEMLPGVIRRRLVNLAQTGEMKGDRRAPFPNRRRDRELLRVEIGQTVAEPDEIEQKIRDLFAAISS